MREKVSGLTDKISARAMGVIVRANEVTGSTLPPYPSAFRRVFVDTVIAKPSAILVDNRERLATLEHHGISKSLLTKLVGLHLIADFTVPVLVMAAVFPILQDLENMAIFGKLGASYAVGRTGYGLFMGLARETLYSLLPKPPVG
jgi:hypothetical protein